MSPSDEFSPPSHAEDVQRGFGVAQHSAAAGETVEVLVGGTDDARATLRAVHILATALENEFTFMQAEAGEWQKAAAGILRKTGAKITSGGDEVVIVTFP